MGIAQDEADVVGAVLHVGRREETGFPEAVGLVAGGVQVFGFKVAQGLRKAEGEKRDDGGDLSVGADAQDRVARADDAGAEQGAGDGEEACVGG